MVIFFLKFHKSDILEIPKMRNIRRFSEKRKLLHIFCVQSLLFSQDYFNFSLWWCGAFNRKTWDILLRAGMVSKQLSTTKMVSLCFVSKPQGDGVPLLLVSAFKNNWRAFSKLESDTIFVRKLSDTLKLLNMMHSQNCTVHTNMAIIVIVTFTNKEFVWSNVTSVSVKRFNSGIAFGSRGGGLHQTKTEYSLETFKELT